MHTKKISSRHTNKKRKPRIKYPELSPEAHAFLLWFNNYPREPRGYLPYSNLRFRKIGFQELSCLLAIGRDVVHLKKIRWGKNDIYNYTWRKLCAFTALSLPKSMRRAYTERFKKAARAEQQKILKVNFKKDLYADP